MRFYTLETILANHPSIFELGETDALKVAVKRVYETGSKEEPISLSEAYEAELSSDARKSTFTVDKNLYNYLRVGYIAKAMPAAKLSIAAGIPLIIFYPCCEATYVAEMITHQTRLKPPSL